MICCSASPERSSSRGSTSTILKRGWSANVKRRLKPIGHFRVTYLQSALYIEAADDAADLDAAYDAVRKVFGIATITRAAACEKDKDAITALAKTYLHDAMTAARSFKVETKRSDKRFPMTSIELSQYVGGELAEAYPDTVVDVHDPELTVRLEVREQAAYVHAQAVEAAGGMPVGCNGAAVTMLSGGIDSPVSSYMIAKRGVRLIPVHFFSFPYTSELAKEKVISLAKELTAYTGRMTLQIVPFTHIQEEIRRACPEEYFTLIMRRFMMRIAEDIAAHNECKAIVTGEKSRSGRQPDHGGHGLHAGRDAPARAPAAHRHGQARYREDRARHRHI